MSKAVDRLRAQVERAQVLVGAAIDDASCFSLGAAAAAEVDRAVDDCVAFGEVLDDALLIGVEDVLGRMLALLPVMQRAEADALRSIATDGPRLDASAVRALAAHRRLTSRSVVSLARELARAYEAHFNQPS